jgi:hypothetical protein
MAEPNDDQSPLVHGFPAWDLLPANPLLLRRKSTGRGPNRPALAAVPPPAVAPAVATATTPQAAPATERSEQPSTPKNNCTQCGGVLEAGAVFCGECGTRVSGA